MGKIRIARQILILIAVFLFSASVLSAIPYEVDDYTVDVEVRNFAMILVPDVKVKCYRTGNHEITVKASASGYESETRKITIQENQSFYKTDIALPDLKHRVRIIDINQKVIASAYVRTDQFGFAPDKFGITVYIPIEVWKSPGAESVEILEPFWGLPFKKTFELDQIEQFYRVKLTISRDALDWSGGDLVVLFKTTVEKDPEVLKKRVDKLIALENHSDLQVFNKRVALFLASNYELEDFRNNLGTLPDSLENVISSKEKFERLYSKNF
jgi:hypothetical protein